jgi:hypothetical protein
MGRYSTELKQIEIKLAKLLAHKDYLEKLQSLEEGEEKKEKAEK